MNFMNNFKLIALTSALLGASLQAQIAFPPTVKRADKQKLKEQSDEFYKVVDPLTAAYSNSTVVIKSGNKIVAMGTVTEKGIVTKLSEIKNKTDDLRIVTKAGDVSAVVMKSSNEDFDLALLENTAKADELILKTSETPALGAFLIAVGAQDQALGLGVVSVKPRSLRDSDRGFLGVVMNMERQEGGGVLLSRVEKNTAASRAGLQAGDIVLTVDGKPVNDLLVMRNLLQKQKPGDVITVSYKRDNQVVAGLEVTLGARENMPVVRRSRMNSMKRMGGKVSRIGEGFPEVLQSDMELKFNFCGGPVIDIDGKLVGVVLARSSRIKTYIIETKKLAEIFKDVK